MNLKLEYKLVPKSKTSLLLRLFPQQYNKSFMVGNEPLHI
jgi:hypothetical protein